MNGPRFCRLFLSACGRTVTLRTNAVAQGRTRDLSSTGWTTALPSDRCVSAFFSTGAHCPGPASRSIRRRWSVCLDPLKTAAAASDRSRTKKDQIPERGARMAKRDDREYWERVGGVKWMDSEEVDGCLSDRVARLDVVPPTCRLLEPVESLSSPDRRGRWRVRDGRWRKHTRPQSPTTPACPDPPRRGPAPTWSSVQT